MKYWTINAFCPKCGHQWGAVVSQATKPKDIEVDCPRCGDEGTKRVTKASSN
jgi:ribosomal protein L44E